MKTATRLTITDSPLDLENRIRAGKADRRRSAGLRRDGAVEQAPGRLDRPVVFEERAAPGRYDARRAGADGETLAQQRLGGGRLVQRQPHRAEIDGEDRQQLVTRPERRPRDGDRLFERGRRLAESPLVRQRARQVV